MLLVKYRYFISAVAGAAIALCLILTGLYYRSSLPFIPQVASISERPYGSIEDLANTADVVVMGSVVGIAGRQIDYGTQDADLIAKGGGSPVVFYELLVLEVLKGAAENTIFVAGTDFGAIRVAGDHETPLRRGEQVVLFLREHSTSDKPGITLYDKFYVPVGMDNGVFDLKNGNRVVPRSPDLFSSAGFLLNDTRQLVRGGNADAGESGR